MLVHGGCQNDIAIVGRDARDPVDVRLVFIPIMSGHIPRPRLSTGTHGEAQSQRIKVQRSQ